MAKIVLGATIGDARNKAGGIVYSRNRYGAYIRTLVSPHQPHTAAQTNIRTNLTTITRAWANITPQQQAGWISLANVARRRDIFGNKQHLTGQQLYVGLNMNLALVSFSAISDPPASLVLTEPRLAQLTFTTTPSNTLRIAWSPAPPANHAIVVWSTPQLSTGRNFVKNVYTRLVVFTPLTTSPQNITAVYVAKYGAIITSPAKRIFALVQYICNIGVASRRVQSFITT
ncbi:MAG: hypothetical protein ACRD59_13885 [Candidatus Acidiferrales bacterium]